MSILLPRERSALRAYGTWAEDAYRPGQGAQGPIFTKTLRWQGETVTVHGGYPITLTYYANAVVDPKRMNELAHLAERERLALDLLETMVMEATNGVGYVVALNPTETVASAVLALVGGWVESRGHPEQWERQIVETVGQAMGQLQGNAQFLREAQAVVNPEHPEWGMAVPIKPIEPREDA